ncbi:MAG TPA: phosphoribosylaminoimidazolesuccinocarboxamide synthase [Atribacteraceae bacterium]|nr:phosphoribosylaminoimidazolesuccinocarboxamide synthase [Atribacteraceae bacterium]
MGSVKDLTVLKSPRETMPGVGLFHFSDRYSVFDWGEMPDHIPGKGAALCLMGAYFFEKLTQLGLRTHYLGLAEGGEVKPLFELSEPSTLMRVSLVRVIHPPVDKGTYDYGVYRWNERDFLIPYEFIYRNSLPAGSSFRKRWERGELALADYGLTRLPNPEERLSQSILDVSTKLEEQDRYLSWKEVEEIGILTPAEITAAREILGEVNRLITQETSRLHIANEDGKIELALGPERELILVDVLGTPDECRFTFQGIHLSKEATREYYRKTPWFRAVQEAKTKVSLGWKGLVKEKPEPLPPRLLQAVSWVYCRLAMDITGREWFAGVPPLEKIVDELSDFL